MQKKDGKEVSHYKVVASNATAQTLTFARVLLGEEGELTLADVTNRGFDFQVSQSSVAELWEGGPPLEVKLERMADVVDTRQKGTGFKDVKDAVRLIPESLALKHPTLSSHRIHPCNSQGSPCTVDSKTAVNERLLSKDRFLLFVCVPRWSAFLFVCKGGEWS